jgi:hypothetical protein
MGTTSIYFDGTGDYLSIPDSTDWSHGTSDFTYEMWVYPTTDNTDPDDSGWRSLIHAS